MLVTRRSGEIQTRKDDSWRGRAIKSLFRQITTNQRQHSSLCYRHTLPYRINAVKSASLLDQAMIKLKDTINRRWPAHRKECPPELLDYRNFWCDLVLEDGLILKSDRVLIPKQLRRQVLDVMHLAHQGETKCILLARGAVFWPGINNDIREMVKGCETCNKHQPALAKLPIL